MSDREARLRILPRDRHEQSVLQAYIQADARKSRARAPGPLADEAIASFSEALLNLTDRCERFIGSPRRQVGYLVLGKVQSGKTAHLIGSLAWAADSSIRAAVVFTGVTGSLNTQTRIRLEKDLDGLPSSPVRVLDVPTQRNKSDFNAFVDNLLTLSRDRGGVPNSGAPLPILVTMKNQVRASAVSQAIARLAEEFGSTSVILAIDDESDQASQNAGARARRVAATYSAMADIRTLPLRNIWLSYTATPQAVLLTDRFGALRPDYAVVVPPRRGYFGISDAMAPYFSQNLIQVDDWRVRAREQASCPRSLTSAMWRFFFVAWVRKRFPMHFYMDADRPIDLSTRLTSTQMLIHESGQQVDHRRMQQLVEGERDGLLRLTNKYISGTLNATEREMYLQTFKTLAEAFGRTGTNSSSLFEEFASAEGQLVLLEILQENKVMIFNSDPTRPDAGDDRPVDEEDYDRYSTWILIGGDILGRGITIPQLTVSYFLRSANKPNFDTVLQQLRFCGYRQDYRKWISIHAPEQTFNDLRHMEIVDRTVWERASTWDRESREIGHKSMPRIFYVSPIGARFEPTRSSVQDPDISDRAIGHDYIFSLRQIFDPGDMRLNLSLLRRWSVEGGLIGDASKGQWLRFDDVSNQHMTRLLNSWSCSSAERSTLEAVSELFEPGLLELGLGEVPSVTFLSKFLSEIWSKPELMLDRLGEIETTRGARTGSLGSSLQEWQRGFRNLQFLEPSRRAVLRTGHVGGSQRALRQGLGYSAVVFIIEPILALEESRKRDTTLAVGIGFAALSPSNFRLRTIGHL